MIFSLRGLKSKGLKIIKNHMFFNGFQPGLKTFKNLSVFIIFGSRGLKNIKNLQVFNDFQPGLQTMEKPILFDDGRPLDVQSSGAKNH